MLHADEEKKMSERIGPKSKALPSAGIRSRAGNRNRGVGPVAVHVGERGLSMEALDRLFEYFDLENHPDAP